MAFLFYLLLLKVSNEDAPAKRAVILALLYISFFSPCVHYVSPVLRCLPNSLWMEWMEL